VLSLTSITQAIYVSEQLSFRRAAAVLGIPQSAVSRRVRDLEDQLGVSLFERHSGGVRTTVAGSQFIERARKALLELDYAVKGAGRAGRGAEGHLRVGIFASIASGFAHDLLAAYSAEHPDVAIDVAECAPREQMARIKERRLDVAFITGIPTAPGFDFELLWHERVFVVVPIAHPLAAERDVLWSTLKNEHFIVSSDEPGPEIHDFIVKQLSELGHQPKVERYQVGRETLMVLVGLGLGLSLISEAGSAPSYPGVGFRPLADGENLLPFCAVWAPDSDNPALRRLLSMARTMSRAALPVLFLIIGLPGYEELGTFGEIIFD
jgi:DNA-binding transcriptional LysR family regulator